MKVLKNVDLSKAFNELKRGLILSEKASKKGDAGSYAHAYGLLSMKVKSILYENTDAKNFDEITKEETIHP
jgi:hypothetical protein